MKKLIISFLLMAIAVTSASAQVEFSKFKLTTDNPLGMFPGRKMLNTKFKVTADRDLKYVLVDYYIVNAVGDVVSGRDSGVKAEGFEYIKPKQMECTGPFEKGKSFSPWVSGVVTGNTYTAFPFKIQVMYMGTDEWIEIPITKDNISKYFPKVPWMEVNRKNKLL